jgi:hypothetical protein
MPRLLRDCQTSHKKNRKFNLWEMQSKITLKVLMFPSFFLFLLYWSLNSGLPDC